jgi:DNA topoisomerase I
VMALRSETDIPRLIRPALRLAVARGVRKRAVVLAVERVAKHLGNTPAVCRRCYIHPEIFQGYFNETLLAVLAEKTHL